MARRFNKKKKPKHTTKIKYKGVYRYYRDYMNNNITYRPWQLYAIRVGFTKRILVVCKLSQRYHSMKFIN